jgi:predicted neuraminidase
MMKYTLTRVAALVGGMLAIPLQSQVIKEEFIFETAPFPQCHASTLAETRSGLVAAWFGGTREKDPDVGIWFSRFTRGAWTAPVEVANGVQYRKPDGVAHRHPTWNPVLFQPRKGPLLLFYKVGPTPQTWWGMLMSSTNGGRTWSEPRRLPENILGPVKNKPVQLSNGDILCPTSTETPEQLSRWAVHFERTRDLGRTWERTDALHDGIEIGAIQPSILFLGGGRLLALGRARQNRVFEVESADQGKTWSEVRLGMLPNPNSGTDAVTLADGRHVIVYNHVPGIPGKWGGKRSPLNVAISTDGRTWQAAHVLEQELDKEFSYPAVIQTRDRRVHITYTWKRERVKHVVLDPAKLKGKPMIDGNWPE